MRSVFKTTIVASTLFLMVLVTNSEAAMIKGVRHFTEKDKTRLVIELDQDAKYQTRYDKDHSLIISLVRSKAGNSQKLHKVNNGLVNQVELREEPGNKVSINVSLTKPAAFNVFPLESPSRIVIDAMPFEKIIVPEAISVTEMGPEDSQANEEIEQEIMDSGGAFITDDGAETGKNKTTESNIGKADSGKKPSLLGSDYGIISAFFDVLILGVIIYMDIKMTNLLKANRASRRNRKEKRDVAPVLAGLSSQTEHE